MIRTLLRITAAMCFIMAAHSGAAFATDDEQNTMEVFAAASPSVVYVTNKALVRRSPYSFDVQSVPRGAGTGFVWDKTGIIVTNYHVIEQAQEISITLPNQKSYAATVVGIAPEKDLAVLRIKAPAEQLIPVTLGRSNDLQVGRKVLAIGNPFGLDATLTVGVISAVGREIDAVNNRKIRNVIQTDAAINPGNSGGPLLNSQAQLVGVNTMIYSPSGANAGIGFAIPVDTVKKIVPQLITHGRLVRPVLGIDIAPAHWAHRQGIQGVPILRVTRGLPAAKAGLKGIRRNQWGATLLGDVIIAIDKTPTVTHDDLLTALESYRPNQTITVHIVRAGRIEQVALQLAPPVRDL